PGLPRVLDALWKDMLWRRLQLRRKSCSAALRVAPLASSSRSSLPTSSLSSPIRICSSATESRARSCPISCGFAVLRGSSSKMAIRALALHVRFDRIHSRAAGASDLAFISGEADVRLDRAGADDRSGDFGAWRATRAEAGEAGGADSGRRRDPHPRPRSRREPA